MGVKEPGFPGFFILGLLPSDTVCHLVLAQNWNVFSKPPRGRGLAPVRSSGSVQQKLKERVWDFLREAVNVGHCSFLLTGGDQPLA